MITMRLGVVAGLLICCAAVPPSAVAAKRCRSSGAQCSLLEVARQSGIFVGTAMSNESTATELADIKANFNAVTSENAFKWSEMSGSSEAPDFTTADRIVAWSAKNKLRLRAHTLLWHRMQTPRSTDFDTYELIFKPAYKSRLDRMLLLSAIQNLWDRGETNGYGQHVTNKPLPGTPKHNVLLHVALGDHQVAQVSAENEARTIGLVGRRPAYDPGRSDDKTPLWNIPSLSSGNAGGSGLVIWDSGPCRIGSVFATCIETDAFDKLGGVGTPIAPTGDLAPRLGRDPHSRPRATPQARQQKSDFLKPSGRITEVCPAASACHSVGWDY